MHKKTRLSVFVLTTIFLFSSSLSGCRSVPGLVERGAEAARDAEPVANQLGKVAALVSEAEIAARFHIDLSAVKAAQRDYPQINDEAQQIYARMVQASGQQSLDQANKAVQKAYVEMVQKSGRQSLDQANDAVQKAADKQKQTMVITGGALSLPLPLSLLAKGVFVDYQVSHQGPS